MAILFMMLAYFPMFGQKIINPQEKAAKDQHGQQESTAINKEEQLTGNAHQQTHSEEQIEFNVRLQAFVDSCMKDQNHLTPYSEQRHTCSEHKEVDIASLAIEGAQNQFVLQHLEEYKQLFISAAQSMTVIDICDNGGFEQDFLHYEGFISTFTHGSDSCRPHNSGGPSFFIPVSLPRVNRFEIVTSGIDPLVGINRTKFGEKALRINNRYGHQVDSCDGDYGVDKITKKFEVTSTNRVFSIWYAVVLENPSGHTNQQPFMTMKCDLDPNNDLCFVADFLDCDSTYTDSICEFQPVDVLDWTCHKFRIDPSFIGDTATLEIFVADCGQSAHFGYAYIDGICEDCDGSALGDIFLDSINYHVNCDGDIARICGSYSAPEICNQYWWLDSIMMDGYTITEISIDTSLKVFCFDFPITNFTGDNCLDLFISGRFTNGSTFLPLQTSNDLEVCYSDYFHPEIDIEVGGCMDNTPLPNGNDNLIISDDYYFVYVDVDDVAGLNWSIERTLVDPYPDEEYIRGIATGTGNGMLELGPFKIQEGGWYLTVYILDSCEYVEYIEPPAYCSGCEDFYNVKIGNIECNPELNEWSFDIEVPSETSGTYKLNGTSYDYNEIYTIDELVIEEGCLYYTLESATPNCISKFIICPPKPCSFNCNLEVYVEDVPCSKDEFGVITYYVDLEVKWPPSKYACYEATDVDGIPLDDGAMPSPQQVGPFTEDIYLTIFVCNSSSCASASTSTCCYKTIYVPTPDCNEGEPMPFTGTIETKIANRGAVFVQPNPTHSGEIIIFSSMPRTEFEILDVHGKRIVMDSFTGTEHRHSLLVPPGLYFLKYRDMNGHESVLKIIKQ